MLSNDMKTLILLPALIAIASSSSGHATPVKRAVVPTVKGTPQLLGLVDDVSLNRDSCGSSNFGDRTFWTCRDTQLVDGDGSIQEGPVVSSTGSYTNLDANGNPALQPLAAGGDAIGDIVLPQYGTNSVSQAFYPLLPNECSAPTGSCTNGSRWAIWPNSPPMVTERFSNGSLVAYTWIPKSLINDDLSSLIPYPGATLYRVGYDPKVDTRDTLPTVTIVNKRFWHENEINYGSYGNVVRDGYAYLYGQANGTVSLARVRPDCVENKGQYEYYVNGIWTKEMPSIGQSGIAIDNASAGGQGTYYYSEPWSSYVWIGGAEFPGATFYITTAPAPTGPWATPAEFYQGVNGNYSLSAYSLQANPALISNPQNNSIFITYTKNDLNSDNINTYSTPLIYVEWE